MQTRARWTANGEPILTAGEQKAMADFWTVYDSKYDEVQKQLLAAVEDMPELAAIVRRMSPDQMANENRRSRDLMRKAVNDGAWAAMLESNRVQGETYAAAGVPFREWFELVSDFQRVMLPAVFERYGDDLGRATAAIAAMSRYIDISMSAIADAYLHTKEKLIAHQQQEIQDLSTPVLQVRDRLLLLPLVGMIDTHRARMITQNLLQAIRASRARVVVIDITGVPAVDSKVANHLLQTVAAARLMGATAVITGLSAEVAQALVTLGVDLSGINTVGDLQGGLEEADRLLGVELVNVHRPASGGAGQPAVERHSFSNGHHLRQRSF